MPTSCRTGDQPGNRPFYPILCGLWRDLSKYGREVHFERIPLSDSISSVNLPEDSEYRASVSSVPYLRTSFAPGSYSQCTRRGGGGYAPHTHLAPDRSHIRPWSCLRLALVQGARSSRQDQEGRGAQDRARGEPGPSGESVHDTNVSILRSPEHVRLSIQTADQRPARLIITLITLIDRGRRLTSPHIASRRIASPHSPPPFDQLRRRVAARPSS